MSKIKEIQEYYNINAKEMALKLEIKDQDIYDLQSKKKKINEDFLLKLHNHMNININWFLSGIGSIERSSSLEENIYTKISKLPKSIQELYLKKLDIDLTILNNLNN